MAQPNTVEHLLEQVSELERQGVPGPYWAHGSLEAVEALHKSWDPSRGISGMNMDWVFPHSALPLWQSADGPEVVTVFQGTPPRQEEEHDRRG